MSMKHPVPARLASTPQDYQRFGISAETIAPHEDGMRTDGSKGTFEWWYFDSTLTDGSSLVITFNTKDVTDAGHALAPYANVTLDRPDGTHIDTNTPVFVDAEFKASTEGCDVQVGPNRFIGDLHVYDIHVETDEISVDVTLTGTVPSWRPKTGHFVFEEDDHLYFAWLPSVPQGHVHASITVAGETVEVEGTGYHDHNWGNCPMMDVLDHWYWGRGQAGPYTVISCMVYGAERYGLPAFPIFMAARDGEIVADDETRVAFVESEVFHDEDTGKPVGDLLTYTLAGTPAGDDLVVSWRRRDTILRAKFIDDLHGIEHFLAKLIGFDSAYLRFTGDLEVQRVADGTVTETFSDTALWEEMYFGRNHQ
jgi:hypothetical protein